MGVGAVVAVEAGVFVAVGIGTLVADEIVASAAVGVRVGIAVDCGEGGTVEEVGSVVVGVGEIV